MSEDNGMQIVFGLDGDEELPMIAVTPPGGNKVAQVKGTVEVGKRYYVFPNGVFGFSTANGVTVNWSQALTLSDNDAQTASDIDAMMEAPPIGMVSAA